MELCITLLLFYYLPNVNSNTIFLFLPIYYEIHNYYFLKFSRASELCLTLVRAHNQKKKSITTSTYSADLEFDIEKYSGVVELEALKVKSTKKAHFSI